MLSFDLHLTLYPEASGNLERLETYSNLWAIVVMARPEKRRDRGVISVPGGIMPGGFEDPEWDINA